MRKLLLFICFTFICASDINNQLLDFLYDVTGWVLDENLDDNSKIYVTFDVAKDVYLDEKIKKDNDFLYVGRANDPVKRIKLSHDSLIKIPNGLKNLKSELEDLKNVQRPKVVEAIAEARSHGDLKENAEYHAAKEQQALIESRVIAINDLIARANVIDVTKIENDGKVIFGSTVKVQDLESNKQITYKLVGQDEADISKNLIFFKSPIGKALIGKNKGDIVSVSTPSGERNFEIKNVEYI